MDEESGDDMSCANTLKNQKDGNYIPSLLSVYEKTAWHFDLGPYIDTGAMVINRWALITSLPGDQSSRAGMVFFFILMKQYQEKGPTMKGLVLTEFQEMVSHLVMIWWMT